MNNKYYKIRDVLVGNNYFATHSDIYGEVRARFFHGKDKDWSSLININGVTKITVKDGDSNNLNDIVKNYSYSSPYTFDRFLVTPGFSGANISTPDNGNLKYYFHNDYDESKKRGLVYKQEGYEQDSTSPYRIMEVQWNVTENSDNTFHFKKDSESTDINGISVKTTYDEYNENNGKATKISVYEANSETSVHLKTEFVYDTDSRLTSKSIKSWPSLVTVTDGDNKKLKQTEFVYNYDNLHLIEKKQWLWNDENGDEIVDTDEEKMVSISKVEEINNFGQTTKTLDLINNIPATIVYSPENNLPVATIAEAGPDEVFVDHFDYSDIFNPETGQWYVTNETNNNWEINSGKLLWNNPNQSLEDCSINKSIDLTDVIIEFDVRVADAPASGGNWGGFHFRKTNKDDQIASTGSSGYVVFLRRNGIVKLSKIHPVDGIVGLGEFELADRGGDWQFVHGEGHHLRVQTEGNNIKVYVDGILAIDVTDSDFNGTYCGFSTYGSISIFDNLRIYPKEAYCISRSYDSSTLQVTEIINENGLKTEYLYDEFQRLVQLKDNNHNVLSERSYFLSKEENEQYIPTDPNFVRVNTYNSELINGKYGNLAPNYGFELDYIAEGSLPQFWADRTYNRNNVSIVYSGHNNTQCLSLNNSINNKTSLYADNSDDTYDPPSPEYQTFTIDFPQTATLFAYTIEQDGYIVVGIKFH